jgi:hypothetical protein
VRDRTIDSDSEAQTAAQVIQRQWHQKQKRGREATRRARTERKKTEQVEQGDDPTYMRNRNATFKVKGIGNQAYFAAMKLQALWRGKLARTEFGAKREGASKIQSKWRERKKRRGRSVTKERLVTTSPRNLARATYVSPKKNHGLMWKADSISSEAEMRKIMAEDESKLYMMDLQKAVIKRLQNVKHSPNVMAAKIQFLFRERKKSHKLGKKVGSNDGFRQLLAEKTLEVEIDTNTQMAYGFSFEPYEGFKEPPKEKKKEAPAAEEEEEVDIFDDEF